MVKPAAINASAKSIAKKAQLTNSSPLTKLATKPMAALHTTNEMPFDRSPAPKCCVRNAIATPATSGTISCIPAPPSVSTNNPTSPVARWPACSPASPLATIADDDESTMNLGWIFKRSGKKISLAVQDLYEISNRLGAVVQIPQFVLREIQLHYLLDARGAELDGDADEEVVYSVLALQVGRAGKDALLVEQDGVDHLGCGRGRSVVGAPALQEADDLGPALTGAIYYRLHPVLGEKLRDRDSAYGGHAR